MEVVDIETRMFLILVKASPFSGNKNSSKIRELKNEIERVCEGFSLSDQQLITVARRNMQGKTEKWFYGYIKNEETKKSTFKLFLQAMEIYFSEFTMASSKDVGVGAKKIC